MIRRFSKLLYAIILVGIALYVVILNRDSLTIHLSGETSVNTTTGVAMIAVFVIGVLVTALFSLFFGMKAHMRERRLINKDKQRQQFYDSMLNARAALAAGDWGRARSLWEQAIKKDPTDIIARVELSRSIEGAGDPREALRVLDEARAASPTNSEVLMRAAELNLTLGNRTAALDNLALALTSSPTRKAAGMARDLAEGLDRIEDALAYQAQLDTLGEHDPAWDDVVTRLKLKKLFRDFAGDKKQLEAELRAFVKRNPDYPPALKRLAEMLVHDGNFPEAAELLIRAAKSSGSAAYWQDVIHLWLRQGRAGADRAISSARTATHSTRGLSRIQAELNLIRLYITLGMLEDAKKALDGFEGLVKSEEVQPSRDLIQSYLVLKGYCMNRLGLFSESAQIWKRLSEYDFDGMTSSMESKKTQLVAASNAPSPTLSTP